MESQSFAFVAIAAAVVALALLVWVIYLATKSRSRRVDAAAAAKWYEYLLAAALLVALLVIAGLLTWWGVSASFSDVEGDNWRAAPQTLNFVAALAVAAGLGLLAFLVFIFGRIPGQPSSPNASVAAEAGTGVETPAAGRLLGLLLLVLAVLVVVWLYLPAAMEYELALRLIYPAGFAVALVLLFDKATRAWTPKSGWASFREWLYCDALAVILLLGFVNLSNAGDAEGYRAFFWDLLHVVLFFFVFWLLDRKTTRYRFLVAQGYLVILPLLLLLWRTVQAVEPAEAISWWLTVWPFFWLALGFFVLELIAVAVSRAATNPNHLIPALKDIVFFAAYVVLLAAAIPPVAEVTG